MISLQHQDPRLKYWGLQGWACQIQASDLLTLFKSWNGLSFDHFFNFHSSRSPEAALQAALLVSTNADKIIERDQIGSNLFFFRDALSTYCFVLDYIFEMARALRNARDRVIEFATHRHRGQSAATQLLLQFLFQNFSFSLQLIYLQIFGRAIPPAEIIQQINVIPRSADNNSDFSVQANIILHQAGASPVRETTPRSNTRRNKTSRHERKKLQSITATETTATEVKSPATEPKKDSAWANGKDTLQIFCQGRSLS